MTRDTTILLVEDSATQALHFGEKLEQEGLAVEYARDAREALAAIDKHTPDLVIADYLLPGTTGDELCRRIRLNAATRAIPILLLTGSGDVNVERRTLEAGADDYVSKSERSSVVLLRVQALLRRRRVHDEILPANNRTPRILAVDDSPTYLELVRDSLESEGYEVMTAATGEQAEESLTRGGFDAVVLDLHLPDVDGLELCERVARLGADATQEAVILVLTGEEDPEQMARTLSAGADDAVHKSRDMTIVKARLGALLRRKFAYEENQQVLKEFRERERRLLRAEAAREAAEEKASLAAELEVANRELTETQSQLVQSAKMASLGELVAGIAHEINNPLGYVTSHLDTVRKGLAAMLEEVGGQMSEGVRNRADKALDRTEAMAEGLARIRELILKLRIFSRLDEGQVKSVEVHENLESVITLLTHRLKDGIAVERDYCEDGTIECQPGPLNQVWMNLLSNAVDAVEGTGRITLSTRREDGQLEVAIGDDGQGMEESVRERIFEPFYTTKPQHRGTGLGLSISYGIVRSHGGTIEVDSTPGAGSTFTVRLPVKMARDGASS